MFTGIVTDLGRVRSIARHGDTRIEIETAYDTADIDIGASVACSGPCLTVVDKGPGWFAVEASAETLARTTIGDWRDGSPVNLERAMRIGDELGGHIVSGHVDGIARIADSTPEGDSVRFMFEAPTEYANPAFSRRFSCRRLDKIADATLSAGASGEDAEGSKCPR